MVTAACVFGGAIQPLVGAAVAGAPWSAAMVAMIHAPTPEFGAYQRGLVLRLASVTAAVVASLFFRPAAADAA